MCTKNRFRTVSVALVKTNNFFNRLNINVIKNLLNIFVDIFFIISLNINWFSVIDI